MQFVIQSRFSSSERIGTLVVITSEWFSAKQTRGDSKSGTFSLFTHDGFESKDYLIKIVNSVDHGEGGRKSTRDSRRGNADSNTPHSIGTTPDICQKPVRVPFHSIERPIGLEPDAQDGHLIPRHVVKRLQPGTLESSPSLIFFHRLGNNAHSFPFSYWDRWKGKFI